MTDTARHAGKIALVTGAGSGIGRAVATRLAHEGATVWVNDVDRDTADETVAQLDPRRRHQAIAADVADPEQVDEMFAALDRAEGRIDVLVCNAAVNRTPGDGRGHKDEGLRTRLEQVNRREAPTAYPDHIIHMSNEGWRRMLAVNLDGVFYCCRGALRLMSRGPQGGSIVCVSSIAAVSGTGPPHYAAAKAGVIGLVRALALEVAPRGIRVNAIAPGPINTPMMRGVPAELGANLSARIPLGRVGQPDEAAATISFLASAEAGFVTGAVIAVNGGLHIG
ncbi:MAG TPA: SDR family NAD(P)-dependent oxidoreductase [Acidimicrobiales bacterium]|nr:SDR family NAD(P)-dependent oxidoreductase [Acidimicrobiales bacterium]